MSVETWDAQQDVISVTPAAAVHLKNQLESTGNEGVRISIKTSGCTGFMYVLEEVNNSPDGDISLDLDNGVAVFVDPETGTVMVKPKLVRELKQFARQWSKNLDEQGFLAAARDIARKDNPPE
jgi:Fe-S cluster assembly iron-binding protein IscA